MTETTLTKDQLFDINEFIYQNGHESLWRVGDKLEKILSEISARSDKQSKINKFLSKHGIRTVHAVRDSIFNLSKELAQVEEIQTEEVSEIETV